MKRTFVQNALLSVASLVVISIPLATFAWFNIAVKDTKDRTIDGEVGLRSYFYTGNGKDKPYEIVTPIHFYNLSRLQNLGVFSGETNFQIGHVFDGTGVPKCINDTSNPDIKSDYLDLKSISYGENPLTILPIGNEGTPFVGHFNGNGIPIRNLKVTGYPDDVGVFGYVDYRGTVDGLVLDGYVDEDNPGVEIVSMGYNSHEGDKDNLLFSKDVDSIFNNAYGFKDVDLGISQKTYKTWPDELEARWGWTEYASMKVPNGARGTSLERLNGNDSYAGIEDSYNVTHDNTGEYDLYTYNKACFKVTTPQETISMPFKYSVTTSSDILKNEKDANYDSNGNSVIEEDVYFIDMKSLKDSDDFQNTTDNKEVDVRLSISATTEVDGYKFSRVVQTYVFEFFSNHDEFEGEGTGRYYCNVYLDYTNSAAMPGDSGYITNYHHGNNIGFLVGHLNGTLTNSYAYMPKMTFNKSGYNPILAETDTGLVGEIGKNVVNHIDPNVGLVTDGTIGTMNFTKIYNSIRRDAYYDSQNDIVMRFGTAETYELYSGSHARHNYVSYENFKNTTGSNSKYELFEPYLRFDNEASPEPIIKTSTESNSNPKDDKYTIRSEGDLRSDFNKVDFIWNKLIEGENRGLGVFKIITSRHDLPGDYNPSTMYGQHMVDKIDECIIANGEAHDKVYFSTAEFDHVYHKAHNGSLDWANTGPLRGLDLPMEYAQDINSFNYPFSRDHNYCFELDLNEMQYAGTNYYMSNTKNQFLINYLSTKIINEIGQRVTSGSTFGFMFHRSTESAIEWPTSLSSYITVGKPDFNLKYRPDGSDEYYPPNCIAFEIVNTFGGNVSVVANGSDVSIYKVDTSTSSATSGDKQLYSMRSTNVKNGTDRHRYFKFHVGTSTSDPYYGMVDPLCINDEMQTDNNALYGHIFKLDKGKYVIGSRDSTKARIYYLAVQGQDKGDIENIKMADMGFKIENVDFLNERPTHADFIDYTADPEHSSALKRSGVSYAATFNEQQGQTFYIKTKNYAGNQVIWLDFADGATTFVTYLVTYSENSRPHYIQDNPVYVTNSVPYRSST